MGAVTVAAAMGVADAEKTLTMTIVRLDDDVTKGWCVDVDAVVVDVGCGGAVTRRAGLSQQQGAGTFGGRSWGGTSDGWRWGWRREEVAC